jgi:hypothetical protein
VFASCPPLEKIPSLPSGKPTSSRIQSIVWSSIVVAAGVARHSVVFWFIAAATSDPMTPTGLADEVIQGNQRGWPL